MVILGIWLFGYLVIWLFGYLVIWLFGYLVLCITSGPSPPAGFQVVRPY